MCGEISWTLEGPQSVTACNCTLCRRYGVLWAYDFEGEKVNITGLDKTSSFTRKDTGATDPFLEIRFCPTCACVVCWRSLNVDKEGKRRVAVNMRLACPEEVSHLSVKHFDGLDTFAALPDDGKCARDMWA